MPRTLAILIAFSLLLSPARAQPGGAWIDAFPEPQQAISAISGTTELDTKSRQGAALYAMNQLILRLTDNEFRNPPKLTPRESALLKTYGEFYQSFSKEYADHLNRGLSPERLAELGRNRPSTPFADLEYRYRISPGFQREAFTAILGQAWIDQWYVPLLAREAQKNEAARAASQRGLDLLNADAERTRAAAAERARINLLRIALGFPALLIGIAWTIRGWRPTRLDERDPFTVRGRRAGWTLKPAVGFASDVRVYTTTTRYTTRERFNDSRPDVVRWHDVHTSHREFVLNTESRAYPFHLRNTELLIGDGHTLSCVWPVRGHKSRSELLIVNHTTQSQVSRDEFITPAFAPGWLIAIGVALILNWPTALLALAAYAIAWKIVQLLQSRRFRRHDLPRLTAALEKQAAAAPQMVAST